MISRSLLLILAAYARMHLCAKFYANRTTRLRVIQTAPDVTDRQSNSLFTARAQIATEPEAARGRCKALYSNIIFSDLLKVSTERQRAGHTGSLDRATQVVLAHVTGRVAAARLRLDWSNSRFAAMWLGGLRMRYT